MSKLTLPKRLKALFEHEISGQLSDGAWENAYPLDHWKFWNKLTIVEGPFSYEKGTEWPTKRSGYNLIKELVTECDLSERMRIYVICEVMGYDNDVCQYMEYAFKNGKLVEDCSYHLFIMEKPTLPAKLNSYKHEVAKGLELYSKDALIADLKELRVCMNKVLTAHFG